MSDHARYREDIGAYLLGALNELERKAFERHLAGARECQEEVERLRPAADALPGSVEQLEPPPGLKARLMAEVERDTKVATLPRRAPARRGCSPWPPSCCWASWPASGSRSSGARTGARSRRRSPTRCRAPAAPSRSPTTRRRSASTTCPSSGGSRVYQVWLQHGDRLVPARTFEVGPDGRGDVDLPDVRDADGVYVTREARGGAQVPSEDPIVSVPL